MRGLPKILYKALIATSFLFSLAPLQAAEPPAKFVRVEDGRFKLGDEDFFFVGSNFYRLALADRFSGKDFKEKDSNGRVSYPLVDEVFAGYAKLGIKVVRLWGFSCEGANGNSPLSPLLTKQGLMSSPLQLNEEAFDRLDYVLASAGHHGVKLILPLVNFEHEYCGMEWWVKNTIGSSDKHLFYTNEQVWKKFTSYVKAILERRNPYTQLQYKDDPSIMAIELANEPHTKDYYECTRTGLSAAECQTHSTEDFGSGTLVYNWLSRISAHVKEIDRNHLLSHGEEGYLANSKSLDPDCQSKHQWLHNGSKGTDYERNATISDIDFLTTHVYPDNWNIPISELPWVRRCVIEHRAEVARKNGKPIILEETGFNERPEAYGQKEYKLDRPYFLSKMFRMSTEAGFAGTMVWQAAPLLSNGRPAEDDDFTFPFHIKKNGKAEISPEGHAMVLQIFCMNDFAPSGLASACISICPRGTTVNAERYGRDPEGHRCYLPEVSQGIPSTPFPVCDNNSAKVGAWGWTKNQQLCMNHPESSVQYPSDGGCSCSAQ